MFGSRFTQPAHSSTALRAISQLSFVFVLVAVGWLLWKQVELVGDFRVDDAYISFSFSKNIALGNGPVFSHGVRVEGYSNFFWVLVVALGLLFSPQSDPYPIARILAFLWLLLGLWSTYRLARAHTGRWWSITAVCLVAATTDVVRAATSALETVPFMSALAFGWMVYVREAPENRRWSGYALLPAALMRIDGFLLVGLVVALEAASQVATRPRSVRGFLGWCGGPILIYAAYFGWRWWFYGLPLPSTYYAKTLVDLMEPDRGPSQVWAFLRDYGALAVLPWMMLPVLRGPRKFGIGLFLAVIGQCLYVAKVGGDWMPFRRFFLPMIPLAAVSTVWGMSVLWEDVRHRGVALRAATLVTALACLSFTGQHINALSLDTAEEKGKQAEAEGTKIHTRDNLLATTKLMSYVPRQPGDRLVTDYAGVYSVFTDAYIIDMWGLCTADIALHGGNSGINPIYGKECSSCYARLDPDYFHVMVPIVRNLDSFHSRDQIISQVFQGWPIDQHIGLRQNFVAGRVVEEATGRALWFLERRRPGRLLVPRHPDKGIRVDYPFES